MHRGFVTLLRYFAAIAIMNLIPAINGQQATPEPEFTPEISVGLAPGDVLQGHFLDFPEAVSLPLTVSSSGTIFVPYAGQVKVEGMMPEQAEQAIIQALQAKEVVKSPQVSLTVTSARNLSVLVLGAVTLPHQIQLLAPAPLSMILGQVGPFVPSASYHVMIAHRDGAPPVDVNLDRTGMNMRGLNAEVRPGDVVTVAQAGSFFALGEFTHPGIFPLIGTQHMTLLQAVSTAGGPTPIAALSRARILRTVDGHREEIVVDIAKLHDGKVADPLLQTDDILYLPRNQAKMIMNSWLNQSLYALTTVNTVKNY
jgi:polysaccharide export outer membrane protein